MNRMQKEQKNKFVMIEDDENVSVKHLYIGIARLKRDERKFVHCVSGD